MRMRFGVLVAGAAALLSSAVIAQVASQPAAAPSTAAVMKKNDLDRPVCRREQEPGIIPRFKKICKTKLQWEQDRALMQTDRELGENRALINSCAGASC